MSIFERITALQQGLDGTDSWMVGEQLKDICRREPACQQILLEDLESPNMGLKSAAAKIAAYANSHRNGKSCVCVPPNVAEMILREFYGLPVAPQVAEKPVNSFSISLESFLV